MMSYCLVYVTCGSKSEAEKILINLLQERLVACGNISAPVTSYFHWEGKIDKSEEVVLILKTGEANFAAVEKYIAEAHSYDVPCILKLPITDIHAPFAKWLDEETKQA